jgi:hypothetical protein
MRPLSFGRLATRLPVLAFLLLALLSTALPATPPRPAC